MHKRMAAGAFLSKRIVSDGRETQIVYDANREEMRRSEKMMQKPIRLSGSICLRISPMDRLPPSIVTASC